MQFDPSRRLFLIGSTATIIVPKIEPVIKYILPPNGGWDFQRWEGITGNIKFAEVMMPGIMKILYDELETRTRIAELYCGAPERYIHQTYGRTTNKAYAQMMEEIERRGV